MSKFQANLKKQINRAFMMILGLTGNLAPTVILIIGNSSEVTFPCFADDRGGIEACAGYIHSNVKASVHKPAILDRQLMKQAEKHPLF